MFSFFNKVDAKYEKIFFDHAIKNINNETVLVNQVGAYGVNLGRIDFYFDKQDNKEISNKTIIV